MKPILTPKKYRNIYHWTVVCGPICWEKQRLQQLFIFQQRGECMYKKKSKLLRVFCSIRNDFKMEKTTVLVQTLSYRRKMTYHLLLIGFSDKLISMSQCWVYVAFTSSSTATITLSSCTSELFPPMTKTLNWTDNFH